MSARKTLAVAAGLALTLLGAATLQAQPPAEHQHEHRMDTASHRTNTSSRER